MCSDGPPRTVQAGNINKSLLTLGSVIGKLAETGNKDRAHIPYRDSKLTRILQNSLGGNAKTAIICAVTPATAHVEESLSSLKFSNRAKNIKNNAKVNEVGVRVSLTGFLDNVKVWCPSQSSCKVYFTCTPAHWVPYMPCTRCRDAICCPHAVSERCSWEQRFSAVLLWGHTRCWTRPRR